VLLVAGSAVAQQLEPRSYTNVPIGMNFLVAGYGHASGGLEADPALLTNAELTLQSLIVGYARALDLWGNSAKFDVIGAAGCVDGSAISQGDTVTRDVCGWLDPAFRISMNFIGAPAMRMDEFRNYRPDLVVGASLQVSAPWGQYDPTRLVNLGTHRWSIRPEIGVSKTLRPFTFELSAGARFYTTNDNFFRGRTREQDPIYYTQLHVIYELRNGAWLAFNGTYYGGGRTTVNGVENDDRLGNTRAGVTFAWPLNRHDSIKLHASTGIAVRTGEDLNLVGVFWQRRWGGGL
jgi:hypothetical protein